MKKFLVTLMAIIVLIAPITVHAKTVKKAAVKPSYATWLWDTAEIKTNANEIIQFLTKNNVNVLYLQIDQAMSIDTYRTFIQKANDKGIKVHALDGSADWVGEVGTTLENNLYVWLKKYQGKANANQKFAGIHLDVEPYLNAGWNTKRAKTVKAYQQMVVKANQHAKSLQLTLNMDMPFWFDEIDYNNNYGKGNLASWVIDQTNSTTLMAYRNIADGNNGINKLVEYEVRYANQKQKPITIGVETGKSEEGSFVSFYGKGTIYLKNELLKVQNVYPTSNISYAVHYLDSWMQL